MRRLLQNIAAAAVLLGLSSCSTDSGGAPSVTPSAVRKAAQRGVSAGTLATGRRVLTMRCVSCHALEPVADYSPNEWTRIVEEMAPRSKLKDEDEVALREYLVVMSDPVVR